MRHLEYLDTLFADRSKEPAGKASSLYAVRTNDTKRVTMLNAQWHSRLPFYRPIGGEHFFLTDGSIVYAVASWTNPPNYEYNGKGYLELRRMAIAEYAPRNSGSRFLSQMRKWIALKRPDISVLISYQDTSVHQGTIYKSDNWTPAGVSRARKPGNSWAAHPRPGKAVVAQCDKVRWEFYLRK